MSEDLDFDGIDDINEEENENGSDDDENKKEEGKKELSNNNNILFNGLFTKFNQLKIPNQAVEIAISLIKDNENDNEIFNISLFFKIADKIKDCSMEIKNNLSNFFNFLKKQKNYILKNDIENIIEKENESKDDLLTFWKKNLSPLILKNNLKQDNIELNENSFLLIKDLINADYDLNHIYEFIKFFILSLKKDIDNIQNDIKLVDDDKKKDNIENLTINYYESLETIVKSLIIFKIDKNFYENIRNINGKETELGINLLLKKCKREDWAKEIYNFCANYKEKINEKEEIKDLDFESLIEEFEKNNKNYIKENPDLKVNLEKQINIIKQIYEEKKITKPEHIKYWLKNEFPFWKKNIEGKDQNLKLEYIAKTIAIISIANKIFIEINKDKKNSKGYYLREIQIIEILLFILKSDNKGLIEEIGTGEGKTTIIFSLAIFLGIMGHKVDIFTSALNLAKRDAENLKNLYDYFDLKVDYTKGRDPEPYKANILYGTFFEFEGDFLRDITENEDEKDKLRNNRPFDAIIIDEVDNIFIDNIQGSTQLVSASMGYQFLTPLYLYIYYFLEFYEKNYYDLIMEGIDELDLQDNEKKEIVNFIQTSNFKKKLFDEIKPSLLEFINQFIITKEELEKRNNNFNSEDIEENLENLLDNNVKFIFPTHINNFIKYQLEKWINNAYRARNELFLDKDYVISARGEKHIIAPVDKENTGEVESCRVFSNGLHQFLEIKEKLRVEDEKLTHTFLSHISFFKKYIKQKDPNFFFYGMTGTLGDEYTKNIYQKEFNSNILILPSYKRKRFVELPSILCETEQSHYENICQETIFQINSGRKVLIISNTIDEAKNIREYLHNKNSTYQIALYTRDDIKKEMDSLMDNDNQVIIATNLAGRGTDIINNPIVEKKGGLHVILTFIPTNLRVEKQAFGRTARKGNKGSGQMILISNGYKNIVAYKKKRNKKEEERLKKIEKEVKMTVLKDNLFNKFCEIRMKYKISNKDYFSDELNERWGIFIKEFIDSKEVDELDEKEIKEKFKKFLQELIYIIKNDYISEKKYKNYFLRTSEGLKLNNIIIFEEVIKNEYYSFAAKYFTIISHIIYVNETSYKNIHPYNTKKMLEYLKDIDNKLEKIYKTIIEPCWMLLMQPEYNNTELKIQILYRKHIIFLISRQVRQNIAIIQEYEEKPLKEYVEIIIKKRGLEDLFKDSNNTSKKKNLNENIKNNNYLDDQEINDAIDFIKNTGLFFVYELSLKVNLSWAKILLYFFKGLIGLCFGVCSILFLNPILGGLLGSLYLDKGFNDLLTFFQMVRTKTIKISPNSYYSSKLYFGVGKTINSNMSKSMLKILELVSQIKNEKINVNQKEKEKNFKKLNEQLNQIQVIQYQDKQYIENSEKLKNLQNRICQKINEKINTEFWPNFKSNVKTLDYLLCIDKFLENKTWKKKIFSIYENIFKIYFSKNLKENNENNINLIVSSFSGKKKEKNIEKSFLNFFDNINNLLKGFFEELTKQINELTIIKDYNEDEGLISLEQLIRQLNQKVIDDNFSKEIVRLILKEGILDKKGSFNDLILKPNEKEVLTQIINIKIETKIKDLDIHVKKNLDGLSLKGLSKNIVVDDETQDYINAFKKAKVENIFIENEICTLFEQKIKKLLKKLLNIITNSNNKNLKENLYEELYKNLISKIEKKLKKYIFNDLEEKILGNISINMKKFTKGITKNSMALMKEYFKKLEEEENEDL